MSEALRVEPNHNFAVNQGYRRSEVAELFQLGQRACVGRNVALRKGHRERNSFTLPQNTQPGWL